MSNRVGSRIVEIAGSKAAGSIAEQVPSRSNPLEERLCAKFLRVRGSLLLWRERASIGAIREGK
jgi:hypothetical protein